MKVTFASTLATLALCVFCSLASAEITNQVKELLYREIPAFLVQNRLPNTQAYLDNLINTLLHNLQAQLAMYDNHDFEPSSLGVFLCLNSAGHIEAQIHNDYEDVAWAKVQLSQ